MTPWYPQGSDSKRVCRTPLILVSFPSGLWQVESAVDLIPSWGWQMKTAPSVPTGHHNVPEALHALPLD